MKRSLWLLVIVFLLASCQSAHTTSEQNRVSQESQDVTEAISITDTPVTESITEALESKNSAEELTDPTTEVSTTEPIDPYEPKDPASAKIALDFDKVLAAGQTLDEKELEKVTSFLTVGKDDGEAVPWGFVRQTYNDPSEIDISLVYYNKGTEKNVSEKEVDAAYKAMGWEPMGFEVQKRTMNSVKEAFKKYTGKDLTEDQLKAFSVWIYLPEYDAYYSFTTDMPAGVQAEVLGRGCTLTKSAAEELSIPAVSEEMIALEWMEDMTIPGKNSSYPPISGVLILVSDGDAYKIVANLLFE